jgi:NADPH2:quinone reductase
MKAAVYYEGGGPEVLKYEDVPDPVCDRKGILIRVEAISIEGGDTLSRLWGAMPAGKPHVVGYQAAGEVIEVGTEVDAFKVGQKVATSNSHGSHAELRAVPARGAWAIPDGFDVGKASVIPIPFGTAHECLFEFAHLTAGETVLVQAGASGVGVAAIQLAKRAGARVLCTASSDEKLARLVPLGMDHGINYRRDNLLEEVRRLTGGKGVDVVLDCVGGPTLQTSIETLGMRGRVTFIGGAGREQAKLNVAPLMMGNRSLIGVWLGAEMAGDRVYDLIQSLIAECARGELQVLIDRTFKLSEAAAAHAYIESRKAVGRVLLIP